MVEGGLLAGRGQGMGEVGGNGGGAGGWISLRCVGGAPVGVLLCNPRVTAHAVRRLRVFLLSTSSPARPPCWAHPLTRYAVGMGLGAGSQGMVGVASHPARCRVETTEHGHHRRPRHRRGLAFHYGTGPCRKTCGRRAIGGTRGGGGEVAALILLSSCSRRSRGHMHIIAQSEPQKGNRQTQQSRPRHICNITRPTVPKPVPVSRRPLASSPSCPPTLRLSPPFAARHA